MQTQMIRLPEVKARTGLSRSSIYAFAKAGMFPNPVKLTERCVAWVEADIDKWIADKIAARDAGATEQR